jgi:hypothetical protein
MTPETLDKLLQAIAQEHLLIDTLETRHGDSLDFHDVAVWGVRSALQAAFEAGRQAALNTVPAARKATRKAVGRSAARDAAL